MPLRKPDGDFEFTLEDKHPAIEIPTPPEPEDVPRTRVFSFHDTVKVSASRLVLPALPPTLPENPTAKQRWNYLLAAVKQK